MRTFVRRAGKLTLVALVASAMLWACGEMIDADCRANYPDYGDAPPVRCAGAWD